MAVSEIEGGVTVAVALGANETELTNRMPANIIAMELLTLS